MRRASHVEDEGPVPVHESATSTAAESSQTAERTTKLTGFDDGPSTIRRNFPQAPHQQKPALTSTADVISERRPSHIPLDIELNILRQSLSIAPDPQNGQPVQEFSLPPTDQGKDAWLVLAAAFFIEAFAWGVPYTFGLFQEYYSSLAEFEGEQGKVAIIGTATLGLMYLGSPVSLLSLRQWPQYRRSSAVVGLCIIVIGLIAGSFATHIWHLILTQGVMYAMGASMLYYPCLLFIDEWFVRRKGLAYGIAWGAGGASGLAFPFFVSWSLRNYSFRTTLRILAVMYAAVMMPALFFLKPRLPVSAASVGRVPNMRFMWKQPFLPCQIGSILASLGYYMPGLFLPTYAAYLGLSNAIATMTIVLLNSGCFVGSVFVGFLIDKWHVTNVILLCAMGGTLSVLLLWGFASSAASMCIFAFLYGVTAGSLTSTWPGVVQEAKRQNSRVETGLAYAVLVAGRGFGSVMSGPLSGVLLKVEPLAHSFSYGYGSRFGFMILFAAVSNALGSFAFISYRLGWW